MNKTEIPWADYSWNPLFGCSRASEGCDHCYAHTWAGRFRSGNFAPIYNVEELVYGMITLLHRPRGRVFLGSMTDLFHPAHHPRFVEAVIGAALLFPQTTFIILTKRAPEAGLFFNSRYPLACVNSLRFWGTVYAPIADVLERIKAERGDFFNADIPFLRHNAWPAPNIWLGVSCETQMHANIRIPWLLRIPAAVRVVSLEPLLGPISLESPLHDIHYLGGTPRLDWVIAGPETGAGARPAQPGWFDDLSQQCAAAAVPFFDKNEPGPDNFGRAFPELKNGSTGEA